MSKGSTQRPSSVAAEELDQRWAAVFGKKPAAGNAPALQPEQEPEWYHFIRRGDDCFVPYKGQAPEGTTPLYTTPPKRQPLTDEEIENIAAQTLFPVNFARAIEAAHGIEGDA